jgi:hypothetical protein
VQLHSVVGCCLALPSVVVVAAVAWLLVAFASTVAALELLVPCAPKEFEKGQQLCADSKFE